MFSFGKSKSETEKNQKNILIIDDEKLVSKILGKRLMSHGHKVSILADPKIALQVVRKMKPDLIIMDHLMPGVEGVDLCKKLKRLEDLASIPVIIFTGHEQINFEKHCINAGALGVVHKPDMKSLIDIINKLSGFGQAAA